MSKFSPSKLTKEQQNELLIDFCYVISLLSDNNKAAQFVKDLLSPQEIEMLAKRVKIAQYLVSGEGYKFIQDSLKVSAGTVARVNEWLKRSGEGYRFVAQNLIEKRNKNLKKLEEKEKNYEWQRIKRKYPLIFWPQLLIQEIARSASSRQKKQLLSVLNKIEDKPKMYKEIEKSLRQNFHTIKY